MIPASIGSVAFFTAVNAFGVRASSVASIVTVAIRLLPLAGVILIFALRGIGSSAYEPLAPMALTPGNIATATALTFFALTGFENATTPVDKVRWRGHLRRSCDGLLGEGWLLPRGDVAVCHESQTG